VNIMYGNVFTEKKILITGHTGFKGSWLTSWLLKLDASVCGVSIDVPTSPSMFEILNLHNKIEHNICDIRNYERLQDIIIKYQPDFIFHLAAQPIVSRSYFEPLNTISTNVIGTTNLLDISRKLDRKCCIIIVTSDKCYNNNEWVWGYRENDRLGGDDIYSASKAACEILFNSFSKTYFNPEDSKVSIGSVRAGNVIGGGDWAKDRIVVDCVRSWTDSRSVVIRCPDATRPWQHVLEPLSGYLLYAHDLYTNKISSGESFNFGPSSEENISVVDLINDLYSKFNVPGILEPYEVVDKIAFNESSLLRLNCDKALSLLKWRSNFEYSRTIDFIADWYNKFYYDDIDMYDFTLSQIEFYCELAKKKQLIWTK